jgi:hypothetical protein
MATKIRKSDRRVSHLIKYYQYFGKMRDFKDTNMINSGNIMNIHSIS